MKILDNREVEQKTRRVAYEIAESNFDEKKVILAGINNNGTTFAKMLKKELEAIGSTKVILTRIRLSPANPLANEVKLEMPLEEVKNKVVILVDDVANTGRTIFFACKPLLEIIPKKIEVAVLVDRKHKSFPVKVDYMGLSLATTLKENISVYINDDKEYSVYLD